MSETVKKRKVSKKKKKSWRKNVDIKDVDKFLDNKRLEERLGVPFVERPDSELFSFDRSRDETLLISKRERRARLKLKEPKCFAILKPHSAVPDPITKRNRVKTPEERKNPITRRIEKERKINGVLKLREKIALKNRAIAKESKTKPRNRGEYKVDIWEGNLNIPPELNSEWNTSDTVRHILANSGRIKKRVPATLTKKPSVLPAIQNPHPGTSYNPSFADHQDLLREVAEKQLKYEKEEAHLNRVTSKMFTKISPEGRDQNTIKEMSEGLQAKSENKIQNFEPEDEDNNSAIKSVNHPTKKEKKTLQKRRKQREQRQLELERREQKVEKKKLADLYKLKFLKKQLERKEKKEKILRDKRESNKMRKIIEPKVLSKVKFETPEIDFKLGTELTGNLRNSEPAGNLLKDRYKSLQQRNMIAPGTLILKRTKPNVKKYIKADHKINCKDTSKNNASLQ